MERIFSLHRQEFGADPLVVAEAPGSIHLLGNRTDCEPGSVLAVNTDRRISAAISFRNDLNFHFCFHDLGESRHSGIANNKFRKEDRWANYAKGVLYRLSDMGFNIHGLDISLFGELPKGTGISFNLSVSAAVLTGVNTLLDLGLSTGQMADIIFWCEQVYIGEGECATSAYGMLDGNDGAMTFADFRTGISEIIPFDDPEARIVVTVSNVPAVLDVAGNAERKKYISKAVSVINANKSVLDRYFRISDFRELLVSYPDKIKRCCIHMAEESKRALDGAELLRQRRFAEFGKLLNRSHESLRGNFEISCPELDWLVKRAQETAGVYGSRMLGSSFGGSTVAIIKEQAVKSYLKKLEEYERIFGFRTKVFVSSPSKGAGIIYSAH